MASPRNRRGKDIIPQEEEEVSPEAMEEYESSLAEERRLLEEWNAEEEKNEKEPSTEEQEENDDLLDLDKEEYDPESDVPSLTKSGQQRASHYAVTNFGKVEKKTMAMIDPQDLGLGKFQEPIAMPEGFEAHLRIVSVRKAVNKNGEDYLQPTLEIIDEPLAKDFTHYLVIPSRDTMTPKQYQRAGFQLQEFMQGFGIPLDDPTEPTEDWPGYEGWNILGVSENADYGRQNRLGKFIRGE